MEEQQNHFLQYADTIPTPQVKANALSSYKWISAYEQAHNISLKNMDAQGLIEMLNAQRSATPATLRTYILLLRSFYRWAVAQGFRTDNPADEISYHDIDYSLGCKIRYYRNYQEVLGMLNRIWTPDDGQASYPICVFAWLGIPIKDAPIVKAQDVDLERGRIKRTDGVDELILSPVMIDVLRRYQAFKGARRDNRITMLRNYGSDNFLYRLDMQNREKQPERDALVNVSAELTKAFRALEDRGLNQGDRVLAYSDLVKSGALHQMYLMEYEGEPLKAVIDYGKTIFKIPAAFPGDMKIIYEAYKRAFELR